MTVCVEDVAVGLDHVRARLRALAQPDGTTARAVAGIDDPALADPQLQRLCRAFGLDAFEAQVLLLCLGVEIAPDIAALCAECLEDPDATGATFRLAVALFPGCDWRSLTPGAPLRSWDLIAVDDEARLLDAPIRLREFTLHWLCGVPGRDARLLDALQPVHVTAAPDLPPSHGAVARTIGRALCRPRARIQLCCADRDDSVAVALAACRHAGVGLDRIHADALDQPWRDRAMLTRLVRREHALIPGALLVEAGTAERMAGLAAFLREVDAPVIVWTEVRGGLPGMAATIFDLPPPSRDEQRALWRRHLDGVAERPDDLVDRFDLRRSAIDAAIVAALARDDGGMPLRDRLAEACREQLRGGLESLAQRLPDRSRLDDLVLPASQRQQLESIADDVRNQAAVRAHWGDGRGMGLCALFSGPSGTGKTTAAEAIAHALDLDLYRIDLSQVVSKYIGETEKQLDRVFAAAERSGSVLLFDESDALFGKRSEVRDSHDRYANQEVSFLLQRLETYAGLAILTTNLPDSLDTAFLRRFRYVVDFPLPPAAQREEIWRRVFPAGVRVADLDTARLARLNLTGGHIRNIALQATFYAAAGGGPVTMEQIRRAVEDEYRKLRRTLTDYERDL